MANTQAWENWISALNNGARLRLMLDHPLEYELERGQYNFYLSEIHGIWDEQATIHQRLSRASFMKGVLPEAENYFLDFGLIPYNKDYPRSDIPFLTALN